MFLTCNTYETYAISMHVLCKKNIAISLYVKMKIKWFSI
jgi:hypothetical protein